jgi:hypothetical protein
VRWQRGEWDLNGQTIKVSVDGALLDGQHRLEAVVHSGVTISSVVVRGLSPAARDTIDTGRRRRLADVLAIEGYPDAIALATGVNALYRLRKKVRIDYARSTAPTAQLPAGRGLAPELRWTDTSRSQKALPPRTRYAV